MSTPPDLSINLFTRAIAHILLFALATASLFMPAHAELISAQEASQESARAVAAHPRAALQRLLLRADVVNALHVQGVSIDMARERLAALTDEEVRQLGIDIETAPAGAGIVGAAVLVFLVLLATDIAGYTDVFPFTRPAR